MMITNKKIRYEYLITLSFWLSIHLGLKEIANMILEQDELIKMLVANIYSTRASEPKGTLGKTMDASKTFSGRKNNLNIGNSVIR